MKIIILTDSTDTEFLVTTKKFFRTIFGDICVKQIPKKRMNMAIWYAENEPHSTELMTHEPSQYDQGWNDCVDYILSKEEEE